jgi:hypothetical protein
MEMETWFSREVGRDGLLPRNTAFADGMRRSVTKRLPQGAPERMAARLGKGIRQIYHEHASETTYSLDVWMAGLLELPYHESRMLLRRVARPIRGLVIEDPSFFDEEMN